MKQAISPSISPSSSMSYSSSISPSPSECIGPAYQSDPNGIEAKRLLYKAYEAIHKYENFHGGTNRRSELNDRIDQVKEWMIEQWPDIDTGSYAASGMSYSALNGFGSAVGSLIGATAGLNSSMAQAGVSAAQAWAQVYNQRQAQANKQAMDAFMAPKKPWHEVIKKTGQKLAWDLGLYKK